MAVYRTIPDTEIDQDSPVTVTLLAALRDNLTATAEGAAGAPRLHRNISALSGTSANLAFSGLSDFGGVILQGAVQNSGDSSVKLSLSNDGITFSASTTLFTITATGADDLANHYWVFVDLTTGAYEGCQMAGFNTAGTAGTFSGTLAGGAAAVDVIRVQGQSGQKTVAFLEATGGTSTT